jgi:phosphatidylserine/phosphatidylglycerophosphate/cardiolipin synthase-like enzyme
MHKKSLFNFRNSARWVTLVSLLIGIGGAHTVYLYGSKIVVEYLTHTIQKDSNATPTLDLASETALKKLFSKKGYCTLFSPDDAIYEIMLYLISQETARIKIAIFTFTDSIICQALISAIQRGIRVDIITDRSAIFDQYGKVDELYRNGAHVYVYNPQWNNKNRRGIMHNKFIIFEQNMNDRSLVWTGSYNFTRAARQINQENVVVLNRSGAVKKFQAQFELILRRSDIYRPFLIPYNPEIDK